MVRDRYIAILEAISLGYRRWGEIKKIVEARLGEHIPPKNYTELLNRLIESGFIIKDEEGYILQDLILKDAVGELRR